MSISEERYPKQLFNHELMSKPGRGNLETLEQVYIRIYQRVSRLYVGMALTHP